MSLLPRTTLHSDSEQLPSNMNNNVTTVVSFCEDDLLLFFLSCLDVFYLQQALSTFKHSASPRARGGQVGETRT
jgi:hypothetical protein